MTEAFPISVTHFIPKKCYELIRGAFEVGGGPWLKDGRDSNGIFRVMISHN